MLCNHCGLSCTIEGKHGDLATIKQAIFFAADYDDTTITIGGGEPTLHPDFFEILKLCLQEFNYVWFTTNGSQTNIMYRLYNILIEYEYPEYNCKNHLTAEKYKQYDCLCHEKLDYDSIQSDDRLGVDLSLDYYHSEIDQEIMDIWKHWSQISDHFNIRDTSKSTIAAGRAVENNLSNINDCICSDIFIQPDGQIRVCGCSNAPIIGNVYNNITTKWQNRLWNDDQFRNTNCHQDLTKLETV